MVWKYNVLLLFLFAVEVSCDPCTSAIPLKNVQYRGTNCFRSNPLLCDRVFEPGWYYAVHAGVYQKMPEICPAAASCGTLGPIWLNGTHPTEEEGEVTRTACSRGLLDHNCCNDKLPVQIKNCGGFYVYYLTYTKLCDLAYCFGSTSCEDAIVSTPAPVALPPSDPCSIAEPLTDAEYRGAKCYAKDLTITLCDRRLKANWYRVDVFGIPLDMPQNCVAAGSCGTLSPIWLNGSLPSFTDGIVSRKVCVRGLLDHVCCGSTYDIRVRNCITHNVYELPYTQLCYESYCFGLQECIKINTGTTTVAPTKSESGLKTILLVTIIAGVFFLVVITTIIGVCLITKHNKIHAYWQHRSKPNVKCSSEVELPPPYSVDVDKQ